MLTKISTLHIEEGLEMHAAESMQWSCDQHNRKHFIIAQYGKYAQLPLHEYPLVSHPTTGELVRGFCLEWFS